MTLNNSNFPYINDSHIMLRNSVRDFAEKEIKPIARELDEKEIFSTELCKKMGELGLFGMYLPHKYGGGDTDYLSYIIAVEELARVDGSQAATIAAHNSLGIGPIYNFGTEEQRRKYLPSLCTGDYIWAFGLTEPNAGSDSRGTQTFATKSGNDYLINGSKIFITNGSSKICSGITVQTKTDDDEYTCFILEKPSDGLVCNTMHGKLMWRATDTAEIFFNDCKVGKDCMLGEIGEGSKIMLSTLDSGRLSIAAMGLGLAQGAFEMALDYAKQRKQFGRPISKFQAVSFKLSDMAMKIELARNLLYKACWLKDSKKDFSMESAMAKLYCSEIAKEVADEAVQIFGGYGLMKEYDIERFYRDQRLLQIGEGTSEIQRVVISRKLNC
ncbi:MAG: acyl-CoA dehydrogenase family protein [Marinifilaceae bacterium]|jgi:alkylation response protein AidB-like acyl-CoA dehydrogenase|nr:acyl-CoA dehydrogenase family protein [Marinifilaceae bacterium]